MAAELESLRLELEATAAGRHVHQMYSKHRGRPAIRWDLTLTAQEYIHLLPLYPPKSGLYLRGKTIEESKP